MQGENSYRPRPVPFTYPTCTRVYEFIMSILYRISTADNNPTEHRSLLGLETSQHAAYTESIRNLKRSHGMPRYRIDEAQLAEGTDEFVLAAARAERMLLRLPETEQEVLQPWMRDVEKPGIESVPTQTDASVHKRQEDVGVAVVSASEGRWSDAKGAVGRSYGMAVIAAYDNGH